MRNWLKFWRLRRLEKKLLFVSLLLLPLTALALRIIGFRRLKTALATLAPLQETGLPRSTDSLMERAIVTEKIVRVAAWHGFYRSNCLHQSLVLWWLLRWQGLASQLRFGVNKDEGKFKAHAWIEILGTPLNESEDVYQRYAAFDFALEPAKVDCS